MKKYLLILLMVLIAASLLGSFHFYRKYFRGIWPAIEKPAPGIASVNHGSKTASGGAVTDATWLPLKLPPGFSISILAFLPGGGRVMTLDPAGNLLVSIPSQGLVVALPEKKDAETVEQVVTVAQGLNLPHGLAFRCTDKCRLYIAETDQVAVYDYDQKNLKALNKKKIIDLPSGGNHRTRTILFLPPPHQDKLLISVGSSCNVCEEKDRRRAKILIADSDGHNLKTFASGLRNAVFMAVHPRTHKIWATEMGRDFLGDNLPPDEINIVEEGKNYGWPYCYGKKIPDSAYDYSPARQEYCQNTEGSYIDIPAHSAPLGLAFFLKEGWPRAYHHDLLVAYHGSWNRSIPTGYKIVRHRFDDEGNYLGVEDFITGWLTPDYKALGRPVDILIRPNGTIYVSDDKANVIYRIVYNGKIKG